MRAGGDAARPLLLVLLLLLAREVELPADADEAAAGVERARPAGRELRRVPGQALELAVPVAGLHVEPRERAGVHVRTDRRAELERLAADRHRRSVRQVAPRVPEGEHAE